MKTDVAIVGAGPAGLMLSHLLHRAGIASVVLESHSREYVEARNRAGVLEQGTVDLLTQTGVGERLRREGMRHRGVKLSFDGRHHRIDFPGLTNGRCITVYGQHEVLKDLIKARLDAGGELLFGAKVTHADPAAPVLRFQHSGEQKELACDFIAACDGSHGVCRSFIPANCSMTYERTYPFAWLGILAEAPPASEELVYAHHQRGFALFSMRSPQITRLYLQCAADDDIANWSDDRIWDELRTRLATVDGWRPNEGAILHKAITGMRSLVVEPMSYRNLFLAGDAAHIVPPTGAKGLNLAIADVSVLARAIESYYKTGDRTLLDCYSETCLRRVWKVQRFSWWMTSMLHRFEGDEFEYRRQLAELDYVTTSSAAATTLAENYVGLPMEF